MFKRAIRALSISIALLAIALPASSKVIPTDTEVAVDGNTAIITVDIDSHGGPGDMSDDLEMMVGLYPVDALDESGRPPVGTLSTPMEFKQIDGDTYRAVVELPEAGEWAVVPFPFDPMMTNDMYPSTTFTISGPQSATVIAIIGLTVAILLAAAVMTRVITRFRTAKVMPAPGAGQA